VSCRLYYNHH